MYAITTGDLGTCPVLSLCFSVFKLVYTSIHSWTQHSLYYVQRCTAKETKRTTYYLRACICVYVCVCTSSGKRTQRRQKKQREREPTETQMLVRGEHENSVLFKQHSYNNIVGSMLHFVCCIEVHYSRVRNLLFHSE